MGEPAEKLSAIDLWPIAKKLPRDEQVQLAKLLLRGAVAPRTDAEAYAAAPPFYAKGRGSLVHLRRAGQEEARPLAHAGWGHGPPRRAHRGSSDTHDPGVPLSPDDGMPTVCALNLDHVGIVHRSRLGALMATLPEQRWPEVERALLAACGVGEA